MYTAHIIDYSSVKIMLEKNVPQGSVVIHLGNTMTSILHEPLPSSDSELLMFKRSEMHNAINLTQGVDLDPKFLRNTHFAKKHKKGLKKVQANNVKAMSAHAEAIKALIKPKIPKGSSRKLS
ncbi:hypothetical protein E2I00_001084 [Balaenoptera physalus]|uniref:Uncharacterized protein n=1 Tax=Balaenoptera physalus TaxID=9770 RepID=A0A6A1Q6L9_BALPH|nr:hypothetical protein E2I00_001084 [Balaenoptera physalus]